MNKIDIQRVIDEVPGLNDFGIGVCSPRGKSPDQRAKELADGQRTLMDSVDECNKVCLWLEHVEQTKNINPRHTSYGLKHIAEQDIGYITNGVFITAAIHCGFAYRIEPGSPNVEFNISTKSINAIRRRQIEQGKESGAFPRP